MREVRIIDGVECLQCTKCDAWLPAVLFHRICDKRSRCGRRAMCKRCDHEYRKSLRLQSKILFAPSNASLDPFEHQLGHVSMIALNDNPLHSLAKVERNIEGHPGRSFAGKVASDLSFSVSHADEHKENHS